MKHSLPQSEKQTQKKLKVNIIACCVLLLSGCATTNDKITSRASTEGNSYTQPYSYNKPYKNKTTNTVKHTTSDKKTDNGKSLNIDNKVYHQKIDGRTFIVSSHDAGMIKLKSFYATKKNFDSTRYNMMQISMLSEMGFDFDSATLNPDILKILSSISKQLKKSPGVYAVIVGHTDSDGTDKYNYRLSARRADSTAEYIINRGASNERIYRIAAGEDYPVASNTSQLNKAKNRRVDIFLSTDKALIVKYFREHTCVTDYCQPRKLNIVGYNKNIQPSSKVKMPVEFQKEITTPEHVEKRDVIVNTKTRDTQTIKITYREVPNEINTIRNLNVKAITRELPRDIDSEYLVLDDDQYLQGL